MKKFKLIDLGTIKTESFIVMMASNGYVGLVTSEQYKGTQGVLLEITVQQTDTCWQLELARSGEGTGLDLPLHFYATEEEVASDLWLIEINQEILEGYYATPFLPEGAPVTKESLAGGIGHMAKYIQTEDDVKVSTAILKLQVSASNFDNIRDAFYRATLTTLSGLREFDLIMPTLQVQATLEFVDLLNYNVEQVNQIRNLIQLQ